MSILYTNFDWSSYYPSFEQETIGQDRSFTFTTDSLEIPASNAAQIGYETGVLYNIADGYTTGFILMMYPSNNFSYDNPPIPIVFANSSPIVLPAEVNGTVEGMLNVVEFNEDNVLAK